MNACSWKFVLRYYDALSLVIASTSFNFYFWRGVLCKAMQTGSSPATSIADSPMLSDLERLANLGVGSNAKRDLLKLLSNHGFESTEFRLPLRVGSDKQNAFGFFKQAFLLPHMFFSALYCVYTDAFNALFGNPGDLAKFWASQLGNPNLRGHPMLRKPQWMRRAIPICLHGDAVPVTGIGKSWGKSAEVVSWSSLLQRHSSTIDSHFLIISIMNSMFVSGTGRRNNTMRAIWAIIAWSLKQAFAGIHPSSNMFNEPFPADSAEGRRAGTDIADGYFLVLWAIRGDLDFYSKDCWSSCKFVLGTICKLCVHRFCRYYVYVLGLQTEGRIACVYMYSMHIILTWSHNTMLRSSSWNTMALIRRAFSVQLVPPTDLGETSDSQKPSGWTISGHKLPGLRHIPWEILCWA